MKMQLRITTKNKSCWSHYPNATERYCKNLFSFSAEALMSVKNYKNSSLHNYYQSFIEVRKR